MTIWVSILEWLVVELHKLSIVQAFAAIWFMLKLFVNTKTV